MPTSLADLPALVTARLELAPLDLADAPAFQALTDDPVITGAVHFLASPFTLADAEALIRQRAGGRDCFIGAWHREDGDLAGTVGTHLRGDDAIEIGYWIAPARHGQGYGGEAAGAVIAMLRRCFPGRRIIAECRRENEASWRLLEKLGFRPTGDAGVRPGRRLLERPPL